MVYKSFVLSFALGWVNAWLRLCGSRYNKAWLKPLRIEVTCAAADVGFSDAWRKFRHPRSANFTSD